MAEEDLILGNLLKAVNLLEESPNFGKVIPEIRTNVVYALPAAVGPSKVAGVKGRITVIDGRARASGLPGFGASSHMARLVITLMKTDPAKRAAINIKYTKGIEEFMEDYCSIKGLHLVKVDRSLEPLQVQAEEDSSMHWVADEMIKKAYGKVPDIAFVVGGQGKEPVTVILGETAFQVAKSAVDVADFIRDKKPEHPAFLPEEEEPEKPAFPPEREEPKETPASLPEKEEPEGSEEESKKEEESLDFTWDDIPSKKKSSDIWKKEPEKSDSQKDKDFWKVKPKKEGTKPEKEGDTKKDKEKKKNILDFDWG